MTATQAILALLRKQVDDREVNLELNRKQHAHAAHKPGCFCQSMIDQEERDIASDRAALAAIEATI